MGSENPTEVVQKLRQTPNVKAIQKSQSSGGNQQVQRSGKLPNPIQCYTCGRTGHVSRDCRSVVRDVRGLTVPNVANRQIGGIDKRVCWMCGEQGHIMTRCKYNEFFQQGNRRPQNQGQFRKGPRGNPRRIEGNQYGNQELYQPKPWYGNGGGYGRPYGLNEQYQGPMPQQYAICEPPPPMLRQPGNQQAGQAGRRDQGNHGPVNQPGATGARPMTSQGNSPGLRNM